MTGRECPLIEVLVINLGCQMSPYNTLYPRPQARRPLADLSAQTTQASTMGLNFDPEKVYILYAMNFLLRGAAHF